MTLSSNKALAAELWAMIFVQTIGAVDVPKPGKPSSGRRKLPAPRNYAAAFLLWAILGVIAQLGPRQAKIATAIGGSAILAAVMVGVAGPVAKYHPDGRPYTIGARVTGFLNRVASIFSVQGARPPVAQEPEPEPPNYEEV